MRRSVILIIIAVGILTALSRSQSSTSASAVSAAGRKITSRLDPAYPDLAKRMHIHGVVRVEAVVRPNGSVKSTRALGGNPVLVDAALEAVGKWKFEPSQAETTEVLQLAFDSQ